MYIPYTRSPLEIVVSVCIDLMPAIYEFLGHWNRIGSRGVLIISKCSQYSFPYLLTCIQYTQSH